MLACDKPASRSWNFVYVEQRFVQFLGRPSKSTPVLRAYFKLWLVPFGTKDNPDVLDFAGPGEVIVDLTSGHSRLGVSENPRNLGNSQTEFRES